jgi:hypothetical protein
VAGFPQTNKTLSAKTLIRKKVDILNQKRFLFVSF